MKIPSLVLALACVVPISGVGRLARACGPGTTTPATAFPGANATEVSPQSSIFVVSSFDGLPSLGLLAKGDDAPLPATKRLGLGLTAQGFGYFFQLAGPLQPSTDYVLQQSASGGAPSSLTNFTTAATYDKTPGTPAVIHDLRLWRVHYPSSRVNAGGCVFSEYEGYFAFDFDPPSIPGTPAAEMVSVLSLTSPDLGTTQQLVFTGVSSPLPGGLVTALSGDGVTLPEGGALSAGAALWKPNLEPGRTYCATIATYGRNDVAIGPAQSASVCATAVGLDAPGVGGAGGAGGLGAGGGAGTTGAGGDGGRGLPASGGAAGQYPGCDTGFAGPCIGDDMVKGEGCHCAAAPGGGAGAPWVVALLLFGLRRARRRRSDV